MTRTAHEKQGQIQTAAERVAAKLRDFHDRLPPEEQMALHVALGHGMAAGEDEDVSGYATLGDLMPTFSVYRDWCGTCRNPWNPAAPPRIAGSQ